MPTIQQLVRKGRKVLVECACLHYNSEETEFCNA